MKSLGFTLAAIDKRDGRLRVTTDAWNQDDAASRSGEPDASDANQQLDAIADGASKRMSTPGSADWTRGAKDSAGGNQNSAGGNHKRVEESSGERSQSGGDDRRGHVEQAIMALRAVEEAL